MRVARARYVEAAIRLGSLRGAAEELGISQPTLGQQIELLEEELDTVLLTRSRRGVVPTAAGQALLPSIQRLISAEDGLCEDAMDIRGVYRGTVRVGCVPVLASALIAPVVGRLLHDHPQLRFGVTESTSAQIESAVSDGNLDLGIVTEPDGPPASNLERHVLFDTAVLVYLPRGHPLANRTSVEWPDLEPWPQVTMRSGSRLWQALHAHLENPRVVFEAATAQTLRTMVACGAGIGIDTVISQQGHADDPRVQHVMLSGPDTRIPICLTQRTNTRPERSATTVKALLVSEAQRVRAATG